MSGVHKIEERAPSAKPVAPALCSAQNDEQWRCCGQWPVAISASRSFELPRASAFGGAIVALMARDCPGHIGPLGIVSSFTVYADSFVRTNWPIQQTHSLTRVVVPWNQFAIFALPLLVQSILIGRRHSVPVVTTSVGGGHTVTHTQWLCR